MIDRQLHFQPYLLALTNLSPLSQIISLLLLPPLLEAQLHFGRVAKLQETVEKTDEFVRTPLPLLPPFDHNLSYRFSPPRSRRAPSVS